MDSIRYYRLFPLQIDDYFQKKALVQSSYSTLPAKQFLLRPILSS